MCHSPGLVRELTEVVGVPIIIYEHFERVYLIIQHSVVAIICLFVVLGIEPRTVLNTYFVTELHLVILHIMVKAPLN